MKVTIDRGTWACVPNNKIRGRASKLLDTDGFKCCLGFVGEACGIPQDKLLGNSTPYVAQDDLWPRELLTMNLGSSSIAWELIDINDGNGALFKEEKIAAKLAEIGIEVEFIGEYLKAPELFSVDKTDLTP